MKVIAGIVIGMVIGATVVLAPTGYALVVPAVFSLGILSMALRWTSSEDELDRDVARWTFLSYALHLAISLGISASGTTVAFFGGDANNYHRDAIALARHWTEGTPRPEFQVGKEGFYIALARLYQLIGPYRVAGLVLISLCSALVVPLVTDTTRRLFGPRAARAVLPLVVLLPGFLVWTSQLLREAPIVAGLAIAANLAVRLSEQVKPGRLALLGLTLAVLFTLRANVAYVFAAGLLVGLALGGRRLALGLVTATAMVGLLAAIVLGGGVGEGGYKYSATADLKQVDFVRSSLATAESGVGRDADVSTAAGSVAYLAIGVPQLLFGPFPWQVRNVRQALGLLDAMIVWCLVPSFIRGLRQARRRLGRRLALLVAPALGITVVLALLIGNSGTLIRERIQVTVLLLPFIALGRLRAEGEEVPEVTPDPAAALRTLPV